MLGHRPRRLLHPTYYMFILGGSLCAKVQGWFAIFKLLGGLLLLAFLFHHALPSPSHLVHRSLKVNDGDIQKLMIITLEFNKSTFSGNGVYAKSIAKSLAHKGYEVLVLSAKPMQQSSYVVQSKTVVCNGSLRVKQMGKNKVKASGQHVLIDQSIKKLGMRMQDIVPTILPKARLIELEVEVEQDGWGRLDWKCPWQSFAQGICKYAKEAILFDPSWALVVDWSAIPAFEQLTLAVGKHWRMAFLNFRIFYVSEYQRDDGEVEKQFYKKMESKAVAMASTVLALSSSDANILGTVLGAGIAPGVVPMPLFPPLREDLRILALANKLNDEFQSSEQWIKRRKFFTCCVRLSPEKNAALFASIVEILMEFLEEQGIVAFLCEGAEGGSAYARSVKSRLKEAMPGALIHEGLMGPSQLSNLYSQTLLNLHPCIYDSYGMTVVEAAAFASPSVVHVGPGGAVGAAEFLDPIKNQAIAMDLTVSPSRIADAIKQLLLNQSQLAEVGLAAARRSLSWNEDANTKQLISILRNSPRISWHHY